MAARNARSIVFRRDDDRIGLLGAGRDLVQHAVRVRLQPRHVGEGMQRRDLPEPQRSRVEAGVGGDPVQPGAEQCGAVEGAAFALGRARTSPDEVLGLL
jgi:hypothetical protein